MNSLLPFLGVLMFTLAWILLPLIPAIRELLNPRDAGPLDAVGQDSGDLTFFADSFRQFVTNGGHGTTPTGTALPDGRTITRLVAAPVASPESNDTPIVALAPPVIDRRCGLVVAEPGSQLPADTECPVEVYGAGDFSIGSGASVRAVMCEGQLTIAPHASVVRWAHGERALAVGDGVQLIGRATSRGAVALGRGVQFDRILAPYIVVGEATVAPSTLSRTAWEIDDPRPPFQLARAAAILASQHWLVDENLVMPAGHIFRGSLVVRGSVRIGAGTEIRGSVKAYRTLTLEAGAVITGTAASRGDIAIGKEARVFGPVIGEGRVTLDTRARVGLPSRPASISSERIVLHEGSEVYGSLSARLEGRTAT
jgi:predicted acyltransferase (DUF342 family)